MATLREWILRFWGTLRPERADRHGEQHRSHHAGVYCDAAPARDRLLVHVARAGHGHRARPNRKALHQRRGCPRNGQRDDERDG